MIKGRKLLWAMSSILLLSACTPTEEVTEEEAPADLSAIEVEKKGKVEEESTPAE